MAIYEFDSIDSLYFIKSKPIVSLQWWSCASSILVHLVFHLLPVYCFPDLYIIQLKWTFWSPTCILFIYHSSVYFIYYLYTVHLVPLVVCHNSLVYLVLLYIIILSQLVSINFIVMRITCITLNSFYCLWMIVFSPLLLACLVLSCYFITLLTLTCSTNLFHLIVY